MYAMSLIDLPRAVFRNADLRFEEKEEEILYKDSVQQKMVFAALVMNVLFMGGFVLSVPKLHYVSINDPRALTSWTRFVGLIVVPMIVSTMALLRLHCKLLRSLDWEIVIIFCTSITSTACTLFTGWTTSTLYGKDPSQVWGQDMRYSEGDVLLILDAITTSMCLFIPVRMCFKWIPPVLSVIIFCAVGKAIGSPFPAQLNVRTFALAALTFCALWGAWENERVSRRNFVAQAQVRRRSCQLEQQNESSARILRSLSDALLLLTHDLQIINSDPCFAAMMFSSQPDVLTGTRFTEYLASDGDRERFASALQKAYSVADSQKTDRCSGMIHVNCRDTYGRSFGIYVYHTRSFDSDGNQGYMVALVEAQERETPPHPERQACPNVLPLEFSGDHMSDEETASKPSTGSGSSVRLADGAAAELAAWVDVSNSELTLMRCSAGFTLLGPITEGTGLFSMTIGKKKHLLKPWLERAVNSIVYGEVLPCEHIALRLCATPTSNSEFTALCRIDLTSPILTDEVEEGDCWARVVFGHLKWHRRRKRRDLASSAFSSMSHSGTHNAKAVHVRL